MSEDKTRKIRVTENEEFQKYYDEGFRLAINYIYAKLPEESEDCLNKDDFENFLTKHLELGVQKDFFSGENRQILSAEEANEINDNYFYPLCPDPDGGCMKCPDAGMSPVEG